MPLQTLPCRAFQRGFALGARLLPWRTPTVLSGAGSLLALGSAKPNMGECFTEKTHTTYYGKALAVIRAGDSAGKIQIKVSAPGMGEQCVELNVE